MIGRLPPFNRLSQYHTGLSNHQFRPTREKWRCIRQGGASEPIILQTKVSKCSVGRLAAAGGAVEMLCAEKRLMPQLPLVTDEMVLTFA
ncbi:hypothetical protein PENANT_c005G00370 [Penicillium antarcticum]|uniref:Uncharacterized protein n=1 Tax=Penicillium antarcticum TaxID=416450 RepID=A0A1V6QF65_9EURO|nr:hypothetical protein PENANT_c005G00370 [Penicillium antarcticum]